MFSVSPDARHATPAAIVDSACAAPGSVALSTHSCAAPPSVRTQYVAALASALVKRPDHPATLYNLACAEALAGRADDALAHLRRALELKPEWAEMARKDDDFASVRDAPGWPA